MKIKLSEKQYSIYKDLLLENQEGDSQKKAKEYLVKKFGMDVVDAYNFVHEKIKLMILPLNHNNKAGKFILGCVRILTDNFGIDFKKGDTEFSKLLKQLSKCVQIVTENEELYKKYDKNFNNCNLDTLMKNLNEYVKTDEDIDFEKNDRYQIVQIDSFEQASEYSKYCSWCICTSEERFNDYSENGLCQFYFVLRDDYKSLKEKNCLNQKLLEDYGLSMLAICVDFEGDLKSCTCRWNHNKGGNDHVLNSENISKIVGCNFKKTFKYKNENKVKAIKSSLDYIKEYLNNVKDVYEFRLTNILNLRIKLKEKHNINLKDILKYRLVSNYAIFMTRFWTMLFSLNMNNETFTKMLDTDKQLKIYGSHYNKLMLQDEETKKIYIYKILEDGGLEECLDYGKNVTSYKSFHLDENNNKVYFECYINENGVKIRNLDYDYIDSKMSKEVTKHINKKYYLNQIFVNGENLYSYPLKSNNNYLCFEFVKNNDQNDKKCVVYDSNNEKVIYDDLDAFYPIDTNSKMFLLKKDDKFILKDGEKEIEYDNFDESIYYDGSYILLKNTEERSKEVKSNYDLYITKKDEIYTNFQIDEETKIKNYDKISNKYEANFLLIEDMDGKFYLKLIYRSNNSERVNNSNKFDKVFSKDNSNINDEMFRFMNYNIENNINIYDVLNFRTESDMCTFIEYSFCSFLDNDDIIIINYDTDSDFLSEISLKSLFKNESDYETFVKNIT